MAANFLHGVETIEVQKGGVTIREVKSAVIALIGTAPTGYRPNEVVIINSDKAASVYGIHEEGYTIPDALNSIFMFGGATVLVVNVYDKEKHENDVSNVKLADIIGGINEAGEREGLKAFEASYSKFGFYPKILIAPGFSTNAGLRTAMESLGNKIRAFSLVDAPIGTSFQELIEGRGDSGAINFFTSEARTVLLAPHLKVFDEENDFRLVPFSQVEAGLWVRNDHENGYWHSPSNQTLAGVIGMETSFTAAINDPNSEVNLLNEVGIKTVFCSFGTGFRSWGNRTAAWPTVTRTENFISVRRTADMIEESIEFSTLQFIDKPLTRVTIDAILQSVNGFINTLIGRGALVDGFAFFSEEDNPITELANGHLTIGFEMMPPTPAERITFKPCINIELLKKLYE